MMITTKSMSRKKFDWLTFRDIFSRILNFGTRLNGANKTLNDGE